MNQLCKFKNRHKRTLVLTALFALSGAGLGFAQAPNQQKPAEPNQPQTPKPAESNPFPEDTSGVPVIPTGSAPIAPAASSAPAPVLPSGPEDPVRSPDDPVGNPEVDTGNSFSSSSAGLDKIQPPPDEPTHGRHRISPQNPGPTQDSAKENEDVGGYYLAQKNWRAALSRFESALVLDPENPDVYWGLAESQRHLGQFSAAKANYEKVIEYDPDSKHAKESKKLILADPELAKAGSAAAPQP